MSTARLIHGVAESTVQRDRDRLDQAIATLFFNFLGAQSVMLYHVLEFEGERRVCRRAGVTPTGALGAGSLEDIANMPVLADHPGWHECVTADRVAEAPGPGGRLTTAFPLHARGEILGILVVESEASLPVAHIDLLHGILRIVENHLALLDYGERDTLTSLLNRKTFEHRFEKTRERLTPIASPTPVEPAGSYLALVDIDRFKSINDSHGHLFGDEVLLLVSQLMRHNFRGADQLFRFGGEEFVIVLEQATESGARVALERFRTSIENHTFPQVGRVTVSIGYTKIQARDVTTTCIERADGALYYAKSHGRNLCCHHEALIASGELVPKAAAVDAELF